MKLEELVGEKAAPAIGPYCHGKKFGDLIITSGQLPLTKEGEYVQDIEEATQLVLENLMSIVEAGGGTKETVLKVNVYLKDIENFAKLNKVYADFFGDVKPARVCYEVAALPGNAPVEMEMIAVAADE